MSEDLKLSALGNSAVNKPLYQQTEVNTALLECFAAPFTERENLVWSSSPVVSIEAPEFTSLCPITGQPDFATIKIEYIPDQLCVESKSLKLYLGSFRNVGQFHESCVNRIAQDLIDLLDPIWIRVHGNFAPRGGIAFRPTVTWEKQNGPDA